MSIKTSAPTRTRLADQPGSENSAHPLLEAPLVGQALGVDAKLDWLMTPAEQVGMLYLLNQLRPKVAIEIGTRFGGSLQVLSRYSDKVYSLDIDPEVTKRLHGRFSNVEYLTGPSDEVLPGLLDRLQADEAELSFALVDGDHSTEGVRKDIDALLKYTPRVPMYIVMHDSFHGVCRDGLKAADWAGCPYVHAVELDFVPGIVNPFPASLGQLWGGLALGVLKPEPRSGPLEITEWSKLTYELANAAYEASLREPLLPRVVKRIKQRLGGER
ncbi:MAG: hypothetical protein JWN86_2185 [Planctomycetota bacterium]|nr:hypothetical protein [Planctomycetota bacterium]